MAGYVALAALALAFPQATSVFGLIVAVRALWRWAGR